MKSKDITLALPPSLNSLSARFLFITLVNAASDLLIEF